MIRLFRKFAFFLWPPYEAYVAQKFIDKQLSIDFATRMESIQKTIRESLAHKKDIADAESLARIVYESEIKRRETLENKALVFVVALGLSLSIVSAFPALFGNTWEVPDYVASVVSIIYILAIIHFLVAVYYAINVRRVTGLALPNVNEFINEIRNDKISTTDQIVTYISRVKFNEPILLKKANTLSVAESMFRRGLIFISFAAISIVVAKFIVENDFAKTIFSVVKQTLTTLF